MSPPGRLLTLHVSFAWFWTECKQNHTVYTLLCLASLLNITFVIDPRCLVWLDFFSLLNRNHSVVSQYLFIHFFDVGYM